MGAREGTPVTCTWTPPPPPPPWIIGASWAAIRILAGLLLLLPLFLLRANRSAQAWWIWLPVGFTAAVGTPLAYLLVGREFSVSLAFYSFGIGLAAVWLLTPYLQARHRIGTFGKTLLVLAGFSLVAYGPVFFMNEGGFIDVRPYMAAMLAAASLVAALALVLAGHSVRRRFGRIRFVLWLAVWVVTGCTAITTPFAVAELLGDNVRWWDFASFILITSGLLLALLSPLVLLSFFQPFYQVRWYDWLKLPHPDHRPPPQPTPEVATHGS